MRVERAATDPANASRFSYNDRVEGSSTYGFGPETYAALAELALIVQDSLDAPWSVAMMAARTGFAPDHLAHAFRAIFGAPPMAYVRRLRLERAAYELAVAPERSLERVAEAAGYGSSAAFRRAFTRAFGRAPSDVRRVEGRVRRLGPKPVLGPVSGLAHPTLGPPEVVRLDALRAVSLRVPSVEVDDMLRAWQRFVTMTPAPSGPWARGLTSPPQGWVTRSGTREFRCIALTAGRSRVPTPPLEPWRMASAWCARFAFTGSPLAIPAAFDWIFRAWLPKSGMRYAFAPTVTLFDETGRPRPRGVVDARIWIPVERLRARRT